MKKKHSRDQSKPPGSDARGSKRTQRAISSIAAQIRSHATQRGTIGRTREVNLPTDPARFWHAAQDLTAFECFPENDRTPVLKLLGPLPFPRGSFPVMGFLATLYEHVAKHASDALTSHPD